MKESPLPRAFIVRPFRTKEGVDFEEVDAKLIRPALEAAGCEGFTTTRVIEAGNIREDMFGLLMTADIVIADVSIHNANAFYELGIRHALRPRATVMIRAQVGENKHPFDLQTDRYFDYEHKDPAARVQQLAAVIEATLASGKPDSPVYKLLPNLKAPDPATLKVVPAQFSEEVNVARDDERRGDLRLRAYEARWFDWASEGLRTVGRAQMSINAFEGARETYQWLREIVPDDVEANLRLATIYQRLGELNLSEVALDRVFNSDATEGGELAEAFALRARNLKALWLRVVDAAQGEPLEQVRTAAFRAGELRRAEQAYSAGFEQDLNAFYPGINALSLLCIRLELAKALPEVWLDQHASEAEAQSRLAEEQKRFAELAAAIRLTLKARRTALERARTPDKEQLMWQAISEADLTFLTAERPARVAQCYREVLSGAPAFARDAARKQVQIFSTLGVREEFARAALPVMGVAQSTKAPEKEVPKRMLLFTGHMIDAPNRNKPRFPNTQAAQDEARRMIREAVEAERHKNDGEVVGLAGGACGGDILFHEICAELGIRTDLYLALPPDQFAARSVQQGGPDWIERYQQLLKRSKPVILSQSDKLPHWLIGRKDYSIWQRNNLWMLFSALANNPNAVTLIALWNGEAGDGPGGTGDLVAQTHQRGQKTIVLPAKGLAQLTTDR